MSRSAGRPSETESGGETSRATGDSLLGIAHADQQVYLLRHCQAEGQAHDAPLTVAGKLQAEALADALAHSGVDLIVASPMLRARGTAEPLARLLELPVGLDERLKERVLGENLPDWRSALRASFADPGLAFSGGESGQAATARGLATLADVLATRAHRPLLVTHGNLLALLLHALDGRDGYAAWEGLTNPDLFLARSTTVGWQVDHCPVK